MQVCGTNIFSIALKPIVKVKDGLNAEHTREKGTIKVMPKERRRFDPPTRLKKFEAKDIDEPLAALAEHGKIIAIVFETEDKGVEIQLWTEPTSDILTALRDVYRKVVTNYEVFTKPHEKSRNN